MFYSNTAQQGKQGVRGSHFIICWGTEGSGYWALFLKQNFDNNLAVYNPEEPDVLSKETFFYNMLR